MTNLVNAVLSPQTIIKSFVEDLRQDLQCWLPASLNGYPATRAEEAVFQYLLGCSRVVAQYNGILEALNDQRFEINLSEFRGAF